MCVDDSYSQWCLGALPRVSVKAGFTSISVQTIAAWSALTATATFHPARNVERFIVTRRHSQIAKKHTIASPTGWRGIPA